MNAISIEQLSIRSDLELSVLFGLCSKVLAQASPLSREWSMANHTAHNILSVRRRRRWYQLLKLGR